MLSNKELKILSLKKELKLEDLLLIEHHLYSIKKITTEYELIPQDIYLNLEKDINLIVKILEKNYKKIKPFKLLTQKEE